MKKEAIIADDQKTETLSSFFEEAVGKLYIWEYNSISKKKLRS